MARLTHPNIAALYEAGSTEEGYPYLAMEWVSGASLTHYCDENSADLRERLHLFNQVCEGVQYAHQRGIIHRDLKPDNLLVAEIEGQGVPKIIDFGIATTGHDAPAAADGSTQIATAGTPAYMSPEARDKSTEIDRRTDVYSLGVILYELVAGRRPNQSDGKLITTFKADLQPGPVKTPSENVSALEPQIAEEIADKRKLKLAQLKRCLRSDLDWIVMKAIADNPQLRYPSVLELAQDIRDYLDNRPVRSRRADLPYQFKKLLRRYRLPLAAAGLLSLILVIRIPVLVVGVIALALILGIIGTTGGLLRARRAEADALAQKTEAEAQAERADREADAARQVSAFLTDLF